MGGFTGGVPSNTTRPITFPAFDSSTRFALAGGALDAGSCWPWQPRQTATTETARNSRNPFICMILYKYHRKKEAGTFRAKCQPPFFESRLQLPQNPILNPVRVPPLD